MQPKPKKRVVYKKLNIPFTKELYQALEQKSESEHRSMTGQILTILENNLLKKDDPK